MSHRRALSRAAGRQPVGGGEAMIGARVRNCRNLLYGSGVALPGERAMEHDTGPAQWALAIGGVGGLGRPRVEREASIEDNEFHEGDQATVTAGIYAGHSVTVTTVQSRFIWARFAGDGWDLKFLREQLRPTDAGANG